MTIVYLDDIDDLPISIDGLIHLDPGTTYVCASLIDLSRNNIKDIVINHGPVKHRGKGKIKRDWEH